MFEHVMIITIIIAIIVLNGQLADNFQLQIILKSSKKRSLKDVIEM